MPVQEIEELKDHFVNQLLPVKIYLFGSFANNTYTSDSDFDFYIVVKDGVADLAAETTKAYKAVRRVKQRPIDIIVGTKSRFEERKEFPSIENEVYQKGVLLYDADNERQSLLNNQIQNRYRKSPYKQEQMFFCVWTFFMEYGTLNDSFEAFCSPDTEASAQSGKTVLVNEIRRKPIFSKTENVSRRIFALYTNFFTMDF